MADARYFELNDDIGLAPSHLTDTETGQPVENPAAGTPEPLVHFSLTIGVPTMVGADLIQVPETVTLDPIAGTRMLKIEDALVANAMQAHPLFHEVDPPTRKGLTSARKDTEDARQAGKEA